jgi:hypothetical protein
MNYPCIKIRLVGLLPNQKIPGLKLSFEVDFPNNVYVVSLNHLRQMSGW